MTRLARASAALATSVLALSLLSACAETERGDAAAVEPDGSAAGSTGSATGSADEGDEPDADPGGDAPSGPQGDGKGDPGNGDLADLADLAERAAGEQRRNAAHDPVLGGDISWPQCPRGLGLPEKRTLGLPMPLPEAEYVVIGLTNGPAFVENPCLADQVDWVRERGLLLAAYAVTSFPDAETLAREGDEGPYDGGTAAGALSNVGYQQARYGVASMRRTDLTTPTVWVDVEPVNDFEWSGDPAANAAVVEGVVRGYRDAGYRVGVYSTPYLWQQVVGGLALGLPEWRAAGQTSAAEALARCEGESIQGGEAVMGQWVEAGRDQNLTCPGVAIGQGEWFHDTGR